MTKNMDTNVDFSVRAVVHAEQIPWIPSPMKGVDRRPLDRLGNEVARATTIVRYAPNSSFPAHTHTGGEEFLVLDGVFQDEHGDYPAGTYVRNPPTSFHTPRSDGGTIIMVKLWQYDMADRTHVIIDTNKMAAVADAKRLGVSVMPLFKDNREDVRIETWDPETEMEITADGGAEYLVLEGSFDEQGETFTKNSWLRLPVGVNTTIRAGETGVKVWVKTGHLRFVSRPASI